MLGTEMRVVGLPPFYLGGRSARAKMGGSHCQLRAGPSYPRTGPTVGESWPSFPTLGWGTTGFRVGDPWPLPLSPSGKKSVQLVMEYVPLGSLRDYLPRHSVGLAQLLLFAQQICEVGRPVPARRTCILLWPECPIPLLARPRRSPGHNCASRAPNSLVSYAETPFTHLATPRSPVSPNLPRFCPESLVWPSPFPFCSAFPVKLPPLASHLGNPGGTARQPSWSRLLRPGPAPPPGYGLPAHPALHPPRPGCAQRAAGQQ